jgi:hypothetical protein
MTTRLFTTLAFVTLLALPAAASAQSRRPGGSGGNGGNGSPVALQGLLGFESGNLSGLNLRGDVDVGLTRLTPRLELAGVGSISYSHLESSVNDWEFLPGVRFILDATPRLGIYGDVGLGLYHISDDAGSDTGATMRFAGGGTFAVGPRLRLVAEVGLHPHWGGYSDTTFTLLGGVRYRL